MWVGAAPNLVLGAARPAKLRSQTKRMVATAGSVRSMALVPNRWRSTDHVGHNTLNAPVGLQAHEVQCLTRSNATQGPNRSVHPAEAGSDRSLDGHLSRDHAEMQVGRMVVHTPIGI